MPPDDGLGPDDDQISLPTGPEVEENNPERAITRRERRTRAFASVYRELLAESQFDDSLLAPRTKQRRNACQDHGCVAE